MAEQQQQEQQLPFLLDSSQVAWILNLSERTVEKRNEAGCLPGHVRVFGRHPRWKRDVILAWVQDDCPDIKAQAGAGGAFGDVPVDDPGGDDVNGDCGNHESEIPNRNNGQ